MKTCMKKACLLLTILSRAVIELAATGPVSAELWGTGASPGLPWESLAASADGIKLVGVAGNLIFTSTNAGASWSRSSAPTNAWQAVTTSADGKKLVAVASLSFGSDDPPTLFGDGLIYLSTDYGASWAPANAPNNLWSCVASSADGTKLAVASATYSTSGAVGAGVYPSGDGQLCVSTNSGLTWSFSNMNDNWKSIATSADGSKLVAVAADAEFISASVGRIYVSTNSGSSWRQTLASSNQWVSVASSADGTRLVAADPFGCGTGVEVFRRTQLSGPLFPPSVGIYVSTNSGESWSLTSAPSGECLAWKAVASSADGTRLFAASTVRGLYVSSDGGTNWTASGPPSTSVAVLACSADGYRVVVGEGTNLWTLPYSGPWRMAYFPTDFLRAVASSADGSKLVAAGAFIYTSNDSGATWRQTTAPEGSWVAVASSQEGTRLVATGGWGQIYLSGDSGETWKQTPASRDYFWSSLASSADGTKLAVIGSTPAGLGQIYHSLDSGANWQATGPQANWSSVASSADGSKLVAAMLRDSDGKPGAILLSADSGVNWRAAALPAGPWWDCVASSSDGVKLAAASDDGSLYLSTDSGTTWTARGTWPTGDGYGFSVGISADGTELVVVDFAGLVHVSTNSGASWGSFDPPAGPSVVSACISADGSNIITVGGGFAGTLRAPAPQPPPPPPPWLSIAACGANPVLSWLVPSTGFVLQQSSDPASVNWLDATSQPTLNFTNLHQEVRLTPESSRRFYRLKQQ
jgi:photosystem II stability/assembly factor-like uncharacterized protein